MVYNSSEKSFSGDIMQLSHTEIVNLYSQGESCAEIARSDGCSETSIYHLLKLLGVKIRNRSEANKIFPDSFFITLYNMGLSSSQVGKILGVDSSTVTKRLHTLNFPLRSRNVALQIRYTEEEFKRYFMVSDILDQLADM